MKNIEEILEPNNLKLIGNKDDGFETVILDVDLDRFEVEFNNDNSALIRTEECDWISLTPYMLRKLASLIEKAELLYRQNP